MLYNIQMIAIPVSQARDSFASVIEEALEKAVVIEKYGKPVAVVIGFEKYEELLDSHQDAEDLKLIKKQNNLKDKSVPWEKVKVDLGLV